MDVLKRNNVKIFGDKQPILFSHGFGCDQNMWRHVYPAFEKDHQIVLFDHVGAGKSDLSAYSKKKYSTLQGYAEDILEIIHELKLKDVIFVGHSVSAMIGALAAIKEPGVFSKLVMVGPSPCYINDGDYVGGFSRKDIEGLLESLDDNYLGWSAAMAPVIMGTPNHPEFGEELTNSFCRTNPEIAKHFAHTTFLTDNRKDLPLLSTPALILQCSDDVIAPVSVGKYVTDNIQKGTFFQMEAKGHCPNLSAPQETIMAMKKFLDA
jgi:sigma-B regulation protein RsbQ